MHELPHQMTGNGARRAELDAVTANIPALIAYTDKRGHYLHANDTYRSWIGIEPAEMIGRTVRDVLAQMFGELYWRRVRPAFERALSGEASRIEAEGQFADRYRHVEVYYTPDLDAAGRVRGVVCLTVDITERKLAELELRHRTMLLDQAMEPVFTWVFGGTITYWNRAAEELYGYTAAEAVGAVSHQLLRTRHPLPIAQFESVLVERRYWRGELLHTTKSGREVLVDSIHRLVRYDGQDVVLEANRDITEMRQTEAELRKARDRLHRAIGDGRVGVWEADLVNGALTASENVDELYGLAPGSIRSWAELRAAIFPEDVAALEQQWQKTIALGLPLAADFRVPDGLRWLHVQARLSRSEDGRPSRLSGATFDITEQKSSQEQLRAMASTLEARVVERTRELADANRELETFAYSVSHDLRAPLRSIEGFGEALLRDYMGRPIDERGEDYLRRMSRAAVRMGRLIDDLLTLSRIARTAVNAAAVDLSAIADQTMAALRAAHPERRADVMIQPGLAARGDPGLLRLALENLLSNAWKYSGKNPRPRIEFGAEDSPEGRTYFVRDNGVGFDMRHAGSLFQPFHRLHSTGQFEGTGVGLATVQRIVRRHGGEIWAESEEGKGATFYFTLGGADATQGDPAGRG
jgi:PAS domain S-box-containing protein